MNRRDFLKTVGLAAGSGATAFVTNFSRYDGPPATVTRDQVWHLLNRAGYGPRPGEVEAVTRKGVEAYLEQQLQPSTIDDHALESLLAGYHTLCMTSGELLTSNNKGIEPVYELDSAIVLRAVYSERQLYQVMVNFWSDHFSLWHGKGLCRVLITVDNREVIQANALGKFRDLLFASARSPAMLVYLDNYLSDKAHPNENYAREVLELHSLASGSYNEMDVQELARCFTGWTLDLGPGQLDYGRFQFAPELHDDGPKTVLGQAIPAGGGIKDAQTVLELLVVHPATARHIAIKLCRRFVQDDPPNSIVQAVQQTYLQTDGDIKAMLRTILVSPEFWNAPPKFKRPFEFLVSLFRAFGADVQPIGGNDSKGKPSKAIGLAPLLTLQSMDHLPFNHETPEGYGDVAALWENNLLERWNLVNAIVSGIFPGAVVDLDKLATGLGLDPRNHLEVAQHLAKQLFGRTLNSSELDLIEQYLNRDAVQRDSTSTDADTRLAGILTLLASSPAFMFR